MHFQHLAGSMHLCHIALLDALMDALRERY
jgi:hypothetical protein